MDDTVLQYYNDELTYLRQQGQAFAEAHPKIANRLRLGPGAVEDPFVGRLLEAFAFLTARVRYKLDSEHSTLTQALLNILYPHYLLPVPAMSILQMQPKNQLDAPYTVPQHSEISTQTNEGQRCHFRTAYPVTLQPVQLTRATYQRQTHIKPKRPSKALKSSLSLTFKPSKKDVPLHEAGLQQLRCFIDAELPRANLIYEMLFNELDQIVLTYPNAHGQVIELPLEQLQPAGFADNEALLPYPPHSFSGYRLLTEYFAFPQKFLFFDLHQLTSYLSADFGEELQIHFFFKRHIAELEKHINQHTFKLHCTPIANLFQQIGEPIQYDNTQTEYHVVADAHSNTSNIEVYSVDDVQISSSHYAKEVSCSPYFGRKYDTQLNDKRLYWYASRKACWEVGAYHTPGTESFLSISETNTRRDVTDTIILTPKLTCSNRDLPSQLPFGGNKPVFHFGPVNHELVDTMYCVSNMTSPKYRDFKQNGDVDLISHLALNQITFEDDADTLHVLKEVLALYNYDSSHDGQMINKALLTAKTRRVTERHPDSLKQGFCRGVEVTLSIDEKPLLDHNAYLLGCVLQQFFSKSCSVNSFSKLILQSKQRGEISRWKARLGIKHTL